MTTEGIFVYFLLFMPGCIFSLFTQFSCPSPALWKSFGAKHCKNVNNYHCLWNEDTKKYEERCFTPSPHPAGSQLIIDTNLNAEVCDAQTYQPLPYVSNELNRCVYVKSTCNLEGQTIFRDGTDTTDRKCRCDHQKGYAFIYRPQNRCFCVPSQEDCSCYLKTCYNSSYVLSSGYECVPSIDDNHICSFIESGDSSSSIPVSDAQIVVAYDSKYYNINRIKQRAGILIPVMIIVLIAILAVLAFLVVFQICKKWCREKKNKKIREEFRVKTSIELERFRKEAVCVSVETTGYQMAKDIISRYDLVVIKGRAGTGKTHISLKLATYFKAEFTPYIFEKFDIEMVKSIVKTRHKHKGLLFMFENVIGDSLQYNSDAMILNDVHFKSEDLEKLKEIIMFSVHYRSVVKFIFTAYSVNKDLHNYLVKYIIENNQYGNQEYQLENLIVDLDNPDAISYEEKMDMLMKYCEKHARVFPQDIQDIVQCDLVFGFPHMCVLFCTDESNFALGLTFFQRPPCVFIDKINQLKMDGFDSNAAGIKYTVLVYIALTENNAISVHENELDAILFNTIYRNTYKKKYLFGRNPIAISASMLCDQYLICVRNFEFKFIHPLVRRAVLITYGQSAPVHFIQRACFSELLAIIRPDLQSKAAVTISKSEGYDDFANRMAREYLKSEEKAEKIGVIMKDFVLSDIHLELIDIVFESLSKTTETEGHKYTPFMIKIFDGITDHCKVILPDKVKPRHFCLKWEIITAIHYGVEDTFNVLVKELETNRKCVEILRSPLDDFKNCLFHYIVASGFESGVCLYKDQYPTSVQNRFGLTPLIFAAHLGRLYYIDIFLQRPKKNFVLKALKDFYSKAIDDSTDEELFVRNLEQQIVEGKKNAGKCLNLVKTDIGITLDHTILPTITYGTIGDFQSIFLKFYNEYEDVWEALNKKQIIEDAVEVFDDNSDESNTNTTTIDASFQVTENKSEVIESSDDESFVKIDIKDCEQHLMKEPAVGDGPRSICTDTKISNDNKTVSGENVDNSKLNRPNKVKKAFGLGKVKSDRKDKLSKIKKNNDNTKELVDVCIGETKKEEIGNNETEKTVNTKKEVDTVVDLVVNDDHFAMKDSETKNQKDLCQDLHISTEGDVGRHFLNLSELRQETEAEIDTKENEIKFYEKIAGKMENYFPNN